MLLYAADDVWYQQFQSLSLRGTLTFGHLGLSSQAFSASSRAAWCWPSLRKAAERLLNRMQFCGSACNASLYKRTAAWKSPRWHASLLCCTFSMNSALLRPYLVPSSPATHRIGLPPAREPKIENWINGQREEELSSVWFKMYQNTHKALSRAFSTAAQVKLILLTRALFHQASW